MSTEITPRSLRLYIAFSGIEDLEKVFREVADQIKKQGERWGWEENLNCGGGKFDFDCIPDPANTKCRVYDSILHKHHVEQRKAYDRLKEEEE